MTAAIDPGGWYSCAVTISGAAVTRFTYARTNQPVFAWGPARDLWGPVTYTVTLDGAQLPPTATTALVAPEPLADGPHVWQVTAANRAGLISTARPGRVWVDTVAPVGRLTLTGRKQVGSYLHMYVSYTDSPPPEPRASASGIAQVVVNWGDGNTYVIKHGKFHAYMRPGRYRLTVTLTDRAGNTTKLVQMVRIVRKPTRPPHTKHHHKPNTGRKARS